MLFQPYFANFSIYPYPCHVRSLVFSELEEVIFSSQNQPFQLNLLYQWPTLLGPLGDFSSIWFQHSHARLPKIPIFLDFPWLQLPFQTLQALFLRFLSGLFLTCILCIECWWSFGVFVCLVFRLIFGDVFSISVPAAASFSLDSFVVGESISGDVTSDKLLVWLDWWVVRTGVVIALLMSWTGFLSSFSYWDLTISLKL